MLNFAEWLNTKKPYVFQVTFLRNVEDIFASKLVPRGGTSPWQKPHITSHSEKGVFFCNNYHCVRYWVIALIDSAFHLSDHPEEENFIPVILRFKLNRNSWKPDNLGNLETNGNYYTSKNIDPLGIELWTGDNWSKDPQEAWYLKYIVFDLDDIDNYPMPNEMQLTQ